MALVLLPCDLPSWLSVQRMLNQIRSLQNSSQLVDAMQKLHDICCISLDPDENDRSDPKIFAELKNFLDYVYTTEERVTFFGTVLPSLVTYALRLKQCKPYNGLQYSLQQQIDCTELDRRFIASLVANAFFSTFPRRTRKTHPTLQDCNFSKYFVHLKSPSQQTKLRNVLSYFEFIAHDEPKGKLILTRQVIPKKSLFTMDDWLSCDRPLCPMIIRYDGKIEQAECGLYQVCFSSDRIGGALLEGGDRQEDSIFCAFPELFMTLLTTEALESNEAFSVHGLFPISQVQRHSEESLDSKNWTVNYQQGFLNTHVCFIDATDFHSSPSVQYEDDHILRELNKAFIGFRQQPPYMRLPPVGKSCSSTPPEIPPSDYNRSAVLQSPSLPAVAKTSDITVFRQTPTDRLSLSLMKDLMGQKGGLCRFVNEMLGESNTVQSCERPLPNGKGDGDGVQIHDPELERVTRMGEQKLSAHENNEKINHLERITDGCHIQHGVRVATRDLKTMPLSNSKSSSSTVKFSDGDLQPFAREDSEDSIYNDCEDCSDIREPVESTSLSLQRPLKLSIHRPIMVESSTKHSPGLARSSLMTSSNLQVPDSLPLEGTSMEASFISCHSHVSSSTSEEEEEEEEEKRNAVKDDDDEEGFFSCAEDWDDTRDEKKIKASRQTLHGIPELQLDIESRWSDRNVSTDLAMRQNHSSTTSNVETDDDNSLSLDIHIAGPDLEDRDEFVLRRSASTGFILDEDEDLFMGDGLEHEKEWLAQFRHRSTNPSRSISRRNSSRYSFSSDFSSDLEDIYEHFEEKMTEGPVRENPVYTSRLGDRLKRALSDSLTTFPTIARGFPRSLSLTEKMQQEKLCLEYAKKNMHESSAQVPLESVENESSGDNYCSSFFEDSDFGKLKSSQLPGQLVGTCVAIEQHLSEIEESVTLPLPGSPLYRSHLPRLPSQLSVWWNYNAVYDFCVPLNRFSKASHCRLRMEDDESNSGCSLTILSPPLQHQVMRHSYLDAIVESPDGSSDGPDSVPSLLMADVGYHTDSHQENNSLSKDLSNDCSHRNRKEDARFDQMPHHSLGICRSKSAPTTYEMTKTHLEEQPKFAGPWAWQKFPSVGGIARSVSLMDVEELQKQGLANVGDQRFTGMKDDSGRRILKQKQQSRMRKWQAAFNLSDLEQLGTLHVGDHPLLSTQEFPPSQQNPWMPVLSSVKKSTGDRTLSLVEIGNLSEHVEDLSNGQKIGTLLDSQIRFGDPASDLGSDSKRSTLKGRHSPEMLDNSYKTASSKNPQKYNWTKCHSSDHPSNEVQRSSDQLLEMVLDGEGIKPIATGNWGCGTQGGDPQLKALIQWMAASRANVPLMIYYTGGDERIVKLNIVCRVLLDRHWCVSHVARALLKHYGKSVRTKSLHPEGETDLLDSLLPKETDL